MNQSVMLEENKNATEKLKLKISKVIKASRQRVFEAWTKPEMIQQWFGPKDLVSSGASIDLRVGGAYRVEMQGRRPSPEKGEMQEVHPIVTGVYQKIIPNELLCFTWRGTWDPSGETLVTVLFRDVEGGTEVTLIHEKFASAEPMGGYQQGWTDSLSKLANFCEV